MCIASVSILPLERMVSRDDIECPDDIIPYNCSIQSNSETVNLTWHVFIPNMLPLNVTYSNGSSQMINLTNYITTSVTGFQSDEYIHSVLMVRVYAGIPTYEIILQCSINGLGNDTRVVFVNSSGKCSKDSITSLLNKFMSYSPSPSHWF